MTEQQDLFSERSKHLRWIELLVIPRFERSAGTSSRLARTASLKLLLRVLESHIRHGTECKIFRDTISHEMGVADRTASRAIADAERLGLISVPHRSYSKLVPSVYEINWTQIAQLILDCPMTARQIDPKAAGPTRDNLSSTRDNLSSTRDNLSGVPPDDTSSSRERVLKHGFNHVGNMKETSCPQILSGPMGSNAPRALTAHSGWPFRITRHHLQKAICVQELWMHAIHQPWGLQMPQRVNFFALALWIIEQRELKNPGGMFTTKLREAIGTGKWPGFDLHQLKASKILLVLDGMLPDPSKVRR